MEDNNDDTEHEVTTWKQAITTQVGRVVSGGSSLLYYAWIPVILALGVFTKPKIQFGDGSSPPPQ